MLERPLEGFHDDVVGGSRGETYQGGTGGGAWYTHLMEDEGEGGREGNRGGGGVCEKKRTFLIYELDR